MMYVFSENEMQCQVIHTRNKTELSSTNLSQAANAGFVDILTIFSVESLSSKCKQ